MLEASQSEPLVVSAFLRLPRSSVKHAYAFHYTAFQRVLDVPSPYMLFCSQPDCSQLNRTRTAQGHATDIRPWSLDAALQLLAARLQVDATLIEQATTTAVHHSHCPSRQLIQIWLAKPFVVELAMGAYPTRTRFAWVDAAFNHYRVLKQKPPKPPWWAFWPERGLAVRRHPGACHNKLQGTNHSACIVATFMYGTRDAWHDFIREYAAVTRQLIVNPSSQKKLCTEQDIMQTVMSLHPEMFEEFTTSDGWGWKDARKATVDCSGGLVNVANRCVEDLGV